MQWQGVSSKLHGSTGDTLLHIAHWMIKMEELLVGVSTDVLQPRKEEVAPEEASHQYGGGSGHLEEVEVPPLA